MSPDNPVCNDFSNNPCDALKRPRRPVAPSRFDTQDIFENASDILFESSDDDLGYPPPVDSEDPGNDGDEDEPEDAKPGQLREEVSRCLYRDVDQTPPEMPGGFPQNTGPPGEGSVTLRGAASPPSMRTRRSVSCPPRLADQSPPEALTVTEIPATPDS